MIQAFNDYISQHNLTQKDNKILLAVSGGIDSIVMTDLFYKSGFKNIAIAHCNFSLRGEESDGDEKHVRQFALEHDIPIFVIRFHTKEYAKMHKVSTQVAARELRYAWFKRLRAEHGFDFIAIAHNMNDNMETVLLNLTRGSGLTGLTGIKAKNEYIIRPLLFATRQMIEEYSKENDITYREDSSNSENKYNRNKIRHLVTPVLKEINSAVEENISETSERLSEIESYIEQRVTEIRKELFNYNGDIISIDLKEFKNLIPNKSICYEVFKIFGLTASTTKDLMTIINGSVGSHVTTFSHRFMRDRETLLITPHEIDKISTHIIHNVEELNADKGFSAEVVEIDDNFIIPKSSEIACLDYEKIEFPLILRRWENGDSFSPFGMRGKKKISDYLIDKKVPMVKKEKVMVLTSNGKIAWIVGERIDNSFKITNKSKVALIIKRI